MATDEVINGWKNRRTEIIAACIAGIAVIIGAVIQRQRSAHGATPLPKTPSSRLTGRVISARDLRPVTDAKVSLEIGGQTPLLRYPDAEGVFDFGLPSDATGVRIRVDAPSFKNYDRWVAVSSISGIEEIRLEPGKPAPGPPPDHVSDRPRPETKPLQQEASMLDTTLRPSGGPDGPWSVIVFGGRQDRRGEVQSWMRSALAGAGHDSVALFRKVADEQRVAPDLYRGSNELFTRLGPGRYVSRILVANLTVADHPPVEGLIVAEAKVSVHVFSPAGELLKQFELSEKGGGMDSDSAQRNAIEELHAVIERDLPSSI